MKDLSAVMISPTNYYSVTAIVVNIFHTGGIYSIFNYKLYDRFIKLLTYISAKPYYLGAKIQHSK